MARGFSKATLSKSIGSSSSKCTEAKAARTIQSSPPLNKIANLAGWGNNDDGAVVEEGFGGMENTRSRTASDNTLKRAALASNWSFDKCLGKIDKSTSFSPLAEILGITLSLSKAADALACDA